MTDVTIPVGVHHVVALGVIPPLLLPPPPPPALARRSAGIRPGERDRIFGLAVGSVAHGSVTSSGRAGAYANVGR